jgi:hypothetical protein
MTPGVFRYFMGSTRVVDRDDHDDDLQVAIVGTQCTNGSVKRLIGVHTVGDQLQLTIAQARQLARAVPAADEAPTRWPATTPANPWAAQERIGPSSSRVAGRLLSKDRRVEAIDRARPVRAAEF